MYISTHSQLVLFLHYINRDRNIQELFFNEFINTQDDLQKIITSVILERWSKISAYENAHCTHCYAQKLNLIMQQATI